MVTDTAYSAESTVVLHRRLPGRQHCRCEGTGIACGVLLYHKKTQLSTPDESIVTPYATLPKTATATVQGVLDPNLLQNLL